ncbi:MAG: hypothetical protein MMC33_000267 [Icmadophila ericetorum]|nr:hypothetical protein [Icmadophila ericetorum]
MICAPTLQKHASQQSAHFSRIPSPPSRRVAKPPSPIAPSSTSEQTSGPSNTASSQLTSLLNTSETPLSSPTGSRKRKAPGSSLTTQQAAKTAATSAYGDPGGTGEVGEQSSEAPSSPVVKKGRTNTPWTPAEERRLKSMRDAGSSWSEIAKTFPTRTEGSVKKHWYKDMHYADFAEDESAALLAAIREYEASKWKVIGQKVGKPAKVLSQSQD